ncbi:universal stress protein [bacterium]|nr:universal stress protein [bacterium]MCI0606482.1 universal stress protein [bacterium]
MFKRILVPVDFTDKNLSALDRTYQLAKWSHGTVILIHVIEKVENIPEEEMKQFYHRLEKRAKNKMKQYATTFGEHGIPVIEKFIYGKRAEEIIRTAIEDEVDLIVLSSHKVDPAESWGTLSYKIAVLSPLPVLLVK